MYVKNNDVAYFDSFRVEHVLKEGKTFIGNRNIKTNIFGILRYDSIICGYFCIGFIDFMLAGKTLAEFTNLFSPNKFKWCNSKIFYNKCLKMNECNSYETHNIYPNLNIIPLSNQQQFRLNKINEVKDYFVAEIKERELMIKRLSKYIASFDYFDKSLILLSITTGSISIASFAAVIAEPVGIVSASFSLTFSIYRGIVKKLLKTTRKKKKKCNKIVMLARSKLNSIESKIYEALINNETSHENFMTIINEEKKYRELKESIRMRNTQRSDSGKISLIEQGKKK